MFWVNLPVSFLLNKLPTIITLGYNIMGRGTEYYIYFYIMHSTLKTSLKYIMYQILKNDNLIIF